MKSSKPLAALLERLGITPTFDRDKDVELAKEGMARPFNGHIGLYPYCEFYGISKFRQNFWNSHLTNSKE
jgi:hypothetical protein